MIRKQSSVASHLWNPTWGAIKKISDLSAWRILERAAEKRVASGGGKGWQALHGTSKVMAGPTGMGLGLYGMAGTMTPGGLPGDQILGFAGMPGWTSAAAAPGAIKSWRMSRDDNQAALKRDVEEGARRAGDDFITMTKTRPDIFAAPGGFAEASRQYGLWGGDRPAARKHGVKDFLFNHDQAMADEVRQRVEAFTKRAGAGVLGKIMAAGGNAMRLMMVPAVGASAYAIGDAALSDKPYDPDMAMREGYMGAQQAVANKLDSLSGAKRLALKVDPSLAVGELERFAPGSVKRWEQATGVSHQPGWISAMMENWRKGGRQSFFTYDAAGNRHYTP